MSRRSDNKHKAWEYTLMCELADKAYAAGKEAAMQYKPREGGDGLQWAYLDGRYFVPKLAGQSVERWAYDAGYDKGVKERDAYEARREAARVAKAWRAYGGIVSSGGAYRVGEKGPETFTAKGDETITPATDEGSNDE